MSKTTKTISKSKLKRWSKEEDLLLITACEGANTISAGARTASAKIGRSPGACVYRYNSIRNKPTVISPHFEPPKKEVKKKRQRMNKSVQIVPKNEGVYTISIKKGSMKLKDLEISGEFEISVPFF